MVTAIAYLSGTMLPVRGNHDITGGSNALAGWQTYFDVAKRISGGDPGKGVPGVGGTQLLVPGGRCHLFI